MFSKNAAIAAWMIPVLLILCGPARADELSGVVELNRQSVQLYKAGRHEEGATVSRRAVQAARSQLPPGHSEIGNALNNLGSHLRASGDPARAVEPFREAFALRKKTLGPFDPVTLDTQLSLGFSLNMSGQTEEAQAVLDDYVALFAVRGRHSDVETHNAREVLATIALQEQDWSTAIEHYRVLVDIRDTVDGASEEDTALFLNNLGGLLVRTGRAKEGVPFLERATRLRTAMLSARDPLLLDTRLSLAFALWNAGDEAAALGRFEALEKTLLGGDSDTGMRARVASAIGELLRRAGDNKQAVDRFRKASALHENAGNPEGVLSSTAALAEILGELGRRAEEVTARRKRLQILADVHGSDSPPVSDEQVKLAGVLDELGHDDDAVALYRSAIANRQSALGTDAPEVGSVLSSLGFLLGEMERDEEALPILNRAVSILSKSVGDDDTRTLTARNNLALTLVSVGRVEEGIAMHRDELERSRRVRGDDDPETSKSMNNLALALEQAGRMEEAREVLRQALEIDERTSGARHPNTAIALANYASSLRMAGDLFSLAQAKLHYRRALDIYRKLYGDEHVNLAWIHSELATLEAGVGNHHGAREHFARASSIYTNNLNRATLGQRRFFYVNAVASSLGKSEMDADDTFRFVQWPMRDAAGGAIDAMAVRAAADDAELRILVREKQDLLEEAGKLDSAFTAALAKSDTGRTERLRLRRRTLNGELAILEGALSERFPQFESLTGAIPLSSEEVVSLLRPGEALIVFSPGHYAYGNPVPGSVHLIRHDGQVAARALETGGSLLDDFSRLRCSFLPENCPGNAGGTAIADTRGSRGAMSLEPQTGRSGFDTDLAHQLYNRLFAPVEDLLSGVDHLIIVNDHDALAGVPMQTLLRTPLATGDLADADWLIRDFAVSSLPNVEALRAIRQLSDSGNADSRPSRPFLGIGDPVIGTAGPMECNDEPVAVAAMAGGQSRLLRAAGESTSSLFRSSNEEMDGIPVAVASADAVRQLARLPDTRCELQRVSKRLGGGDLMLDEQATETALKEMNANGRLLDYRVISFATHGLVAGEAGAAEPALVLTPPQSGDAHDDGLLTASEVASLDLNADWVLLSACNTAAGEGRGEESLSGLARAFFYAGARSLLVSHWPVSSPAAVRLTTHAFAEMEADPDLGRAEAMRRSMLAIIDDPQASDMQRDPAYWAPFSVVGEGGPIASR